MSVYVIDQIMGSYKTTWAIQYMCKYLSSPDNQNHFIYVTPFLTEVDRIIKETAKLGQHFYTPQNNGSGKLHSLKQLIRMNKNISSTHQLFKLYDQETVDLLAQNHYILIMDEALDVIQPYTFKKDDKMLLMDAKWISVDDSSRVVWHKEDVYAEPETYTGKFTSEQEYDYCGSFEEFRSLAKKGRLYLLDNKCFIVEFSPDVFQAFKDVYVMTYLFEGSVMKSYFDYNHIEYTKKSIDFSCPENLRLIEYRPSEVSRYRDLITLYSNDTFKSSAPQKSTVLSKTFFNNSRNNLDFIKQTKRNMENFYKNITKSSTSYFMWGSFIDAEKYLSSKNNKNDFVEFNCRATNQYRNKRDLCYAANVYPHTYIERFLNLKGTSLNRDLYALCVMIQWVWRSRIRDGKSIRLYIPADRMYKIFLDWINTKSETFRFS